MGIAQPILPDALAHVTLCFPPHLRAGDLIIKSSHWRAQSAAEHLPAEHRCVCIFCGLLQTRACDHFCIPGVGTGALMGLYFPRNQLQVVWILAGEILGFFDVTTGCCCILLPFSLSIVTQSSRWMQCESRSLKCFNKEGGLGPHFNSGGTRVSGFTKDAQP